MHESEFYDLFGEEMYEDDDQDDLFNLDSVYQVPIQIVLHLRDKTEPIFAEHIFYFEKEDPVSSVEELMNFTATWWSTITDDKNLNYIFLTDSESNKKAIMIGEVVAVSFMTPQKPDWMGNGKDNTDSN